MTTSLLEVVAVVLTVASAVLAARNSIWNWPVGLAAVSCFAYVFWGARLYAGATLQLIYLVQGIWGWVTWGKPQQTEVTRLPPEQWVMWYLNLMFMSACIGVLLGLFTPSASPMLDAITFCLSLFATYLLTYRYIETWKVWVVVNVLYCALFVSQGMPLIACLSVILICIDLYALRTWKQNLV